MTKIKLIIILRPISLGFVGTIVLAISQLNDFLAGGLFGVSLLLIAFMQSQDFRIKKRLPLIVFFIALYMTILTAWFRNIEALGWRNIWLFPPQFWLLLVVGLSSLICAFVASLPLVLLPKFNAWSKIKSFSLPGVYLWSIAMVSVELLLSLTFSVLSKANDGIIAPTWNMYSVAVMSATNATGFVGQYLGFWGTSFLLYFTAGSLVLLTRDLKRKNVSVSHLLAMVFIFIIFGLSTWHPVNNAPKIKAVAVNRNGNTSYLEGFKDELEKLQSNNTEPTVVVLPEYSALLSPYANTTLFSLSYDARYTYPEKFGNTKTYFVGTEDQYLNNKRYVENYVLNGNLEKLKRQSKTFLIPGGEYVVGWVGWLLEKVDPDATYLFTSTRSRHVITDELPIDVKDEFADTIGIGACSSILTPYHFRNEAAKGATVLAVNVSYEQFNKAVEYERFANRFAQFTAKATARPIIIGADSGTSNIYDDRGQIVKSSKSEALVEANVQTNQYKTPYVLLGDFNILILLALPAILISAITLIKRQKFRIISNKI